MNLSRFGPRAAAIGIASVAAVLLSACGGATTSSPSIAAHQSLLVWSWDTSTPAIAKLYEAGHPDVTVKVVNVGTGNDQYTALQNAVSAGTGGPDVSFLESFALPQFALAGSVADLGPLGAGKLEHDFAPGPWSGSKLGGRVYSLPWSSGPMVMFYNKAVFDRLGVPVPTTWAAYDAAAKALHTADPNVWILNDNGDAGLAESLIWQAGGTPFTVHGADVTINTKDAGTTRYAENWQQLISQHLLSPTPTWSDDWITMLNSGQIATLTAGSWMASTLQGSVKDGSGDWRVSQLPQWKAGGQVAAEHGGGGFSVMKASKKQQLAFDFVKFATAGKGVTVIQDMGLWPSDLKAVGSKAFLDKRYAYFGGQQVNREFAKASASVPAGFQFLPYQVYANSIFNDTVGQAFNGSTTLTGGLGNWQSALVTYGHKQGFKVN